jgi:23S rRNA (cytidine1920-2'-O)/16S rRNA (cytidine1409-2'-O)-methyltransferase
MSPNKSFASRAGEKLDFALTKFGIDVTNAVCADLGCSTGGFTDCLIRREAKQVYAVDTGYGILDWKLRNNPKVRVLERTNALFLTLPQKMDFISIDVGWTRQKNILPKALELLKPEGNIVSLLKPHYEAQNIQLDHGKVFPDQLENVLNDVLSQLKKININIQGLIQSPITGQKGGNIEYLLWIRF